MNQRDELHENLERLRLRIRTSPARSHTAKRARELIAHLTAPNCPLTPAQQLAALKDTLRTYSDGVNYSDPVRYAPDTKNE